MKQTIKKFLNTANLKNRNKGSVIRIMDNHTGKSYLFVARETLTGRKWLKSHENNSQELIASNKESFYSII